MKKVRLRMKEEEKYSVIKELVDHNGNKHRAAIKLGITIRQINRLIKRYKEKGKDGFIHGNRNRQPINSLPQKLINQIIKLYETKYQGFNFAHFKDMLSERENINVSYGLVYKILTEAGYNSPKIQRATKRKRAKQKILDSKPNITEEDLQVAINHEVALEDSHPRKPRSKYFGEVIQMDASIHLWFGENKTALHLAVDECSGQIVGGYFDREETLNGYYHVFKQTIVNYGIPHSFLTDNRTVFNYLKDNYKKDHKDVLTQFGYACKAFGVSIDTTSVSQAKGLIERDNGTFQGRLVNELRLEGITTINEANKYLIEKFIPSFNKKFALDYKQFTSVMEDSPSEEKINLTLAILSPRVFDNGSSIKYQRNYYQAYNNDRTLACFKPKTKCLVIKTFDSKLYVSVDDKVYELRRFIKHKEVSENFDTEIKPKITKSKAHTPSMRHPWRLDVFSKHQMQAHQHHQYA